MITKTFEVRDRKTFIPVLAVKLVPDQEAERYLFAESGFGLTKGEQATYVLMAKMSEWSTSTTDPFEWKDRTLQEAHNYINEHFDLLTSGEVIDIEFILGETKKPKQPQRL